MGDMHSKRPTRTGRGFPVDEAARLLREGVYLPDYPEALIAEAWRLNYEGAVQASAKVVEAWDAWQADLDDDDRDTYYAMRDAVDALRPA